MRIWPVCIPCIYRARAREILESGLGDEEKVYALGILHEVMSRASPHSSTIRLATDTYRLVKRLLRDPDPYREFKEESNRLVRERLLPRVRRGVEGLEGAELLRALFKASIAANALDPGVPGYEELRLEEAVRLGRDECAEAYAILSSSRRVAYVLDNAGEAVVDLEVVKVLAGMGLEVVVLAKSVPYQNDVTAEEAVEMGFGEYAEVVGTGGDAAGPIPGELSREALEALTGCDAVVAKGMASLEAFLEWRPPRPVIHVLKAKCEPVAAAAGVAAGEGAVIVRR